MQFRKFHQQIDNFILLIYNHKIYFSMFRKLYLFTLLSLLISIDTYAQFEEFYLIDKLEVGLTGGFPMILGDITPIPSWSAGLQVRKTFGDYVSVRGNAIFYETKGIDDSFKDPINSTIVFIYGENPFVQNYLNRTVEISADVMLSYHTRKHEAYLALGFGFLNYSVYSDALDASDIPYDFAALQAIDGGGLNQDYSELIKGTIDGQFETQILNDQTILGVPISLGANFYITKSISIGYETRAVFSLSEFLDGFPDVGETSNDLLFSAQLRLSKNFR